MPHQCLGCGYAFEEGSSALLKGCPECKGTKFYYTAEALDDAARKEMAKDAQKDLRQVVTDMLADASPEARKTIEDKAGDDGWATLKPRDIRKLVKQVQDEAKKDAVKAESWEADPDDVVPVESLAAKRAKEERARIEAEIDEGRGDAKPDTVTVGDGEYEIDVKGLLEKNPIVVQKDGAYMLHLPSLFDQGKGS